MSIFRMASGNRFLTVAAQSSLQRFRIELGCDVMRACPARHRVAVTYVGGFVVNVTYGNASGMCES